MATRFYLPISGTPPLASLAVNSNWELITSLVRLPCFTAKQNTALTQASATWAATTTQQWCWRQWQSDVLKYAYAWTTADTVSMVIKVAESAAQVDSHLAYVIRVVSGDGTVIRGVIGLYHDTSLEYPTSLAAIATRIHDARTAGATTFSSQVGDRIIIAIGHHGVTPSLALVYHNYGDPSATADYALTAGLTTDLVPWVQLSRTVEFGNPPLVIQDASHAHTAENLGLTQHNILVVQAASHGHTAEMPSLTQHNVISIADATHGHTADNISLTQHNILSIGDASHAHTADSPALVQHNILLIGDANHGHTADNVTLVYHGGVSLIIADGSHSHEGDNVTLTAYPPVSLVIIDASHGHSADNVTLTYHGEIVLTIADGVHSHIADNVVLIAHLLIPGLGEMVYAIPRPIIKAIPIPVIQAHPRKKVKA